jgi:hypothetical protein
LRCVSYYDLEDVVLTSVSLVCSLDGGFPVVGGVCRALSVWKRGNMCQFALLSCIIVESWRYDTIHSATEPTSSSPSHSDQKLQVRVTYFDLGTLSVH